MKPKILELEQGSSAWISLRKNKITATDTAKVLGHNPWCSAYALWEEKLGFREVQVLNDKMLEGNILEEKARNRFNLEHSSDYIPLVLEHEINSFQIASLDGMNSKGEILEIKCGKASHEMAKEKKIPHYYFCQLQKQMWVAERGYATYMSYRSDDDLIHWIVDRDDKFIKEMNEKESEFYFEYLMKLQSPPLTDKDYVKREDMEWYMAADFYIKAKKEREAKEKEEEQCKEVLLKLSEGKSTKGCGIMVSKIVRKGNVDYNSIPELQSIDLEKYRKSPTTYMSIRDG